MANVIEQIVQPKNFGTQTIEMTVRSNERGPQGEKGDTGDAATVNAGDVYTIGYGQNPQVLNRGTSGDAILDFYLPEGKPGAVHYTAGPGISITEDNVIEATGGMAVYWGNIKGTLSNQTDLNTALNGKQNKLTAGANVQINAGTISATDTTYNNFIGADGGSGGSAGLVPAPVASDNVKVLKGDGTWGTVTASGIDRLSLLNVFYPVGSYYETSDTNFNPNTSWGGTWVEDTKGRVTVAKADSGTFSTVGGTGGVESTSHRHWQSGGSDGGSYYDLTDSGVSEQGLDTRVTIAPRLTFLNSGSGTTTLRQSSTYDATVSALQPYIVVRRWHRTA